MIEKIAIMEMGEEEVASPGGGGGGAAKGTSSCAALACQATNLYVWVWCGFAGFGVHLASVQFGVKIWML